MSVIIGQKEPIVITLGTVTTVIPQIKRRYPENSPTARKVLVISAGN